MVKLTTRFEDQAGGIFRTADDAAISDIAILMGKRGEQEGIAIGLAKIIFERRAEVGAVFAEYDQLIRDKPEYAPKPPIPAQPPEGVTNGSLQNDRDADGQNSAHQGGAQK